MKKNIARLPGLALLLVLMGAAVVMSGCHGIPKGTAPAIVMGTVTLQATGAGLVKADAQKTSFQIECGLCGYETEVITIDTPAPGKDYTLDWVCPKCGHKQKVTIRAVPAGMPAK